MVGQFGMRQLWVFDGWAMGVSWGRRGTGYEGVCKRWMEKRSLVWGLGNAMNARLGSVLRVKWLVEGTGKAMVSRGCSEFLEGVCACAFMHTFLYAEANGQ